MPAPDDFLVFHAIRRVRRRLRMQAALDGAALGLVGAAVVALVAIYLARLHVLGARGLAGAGALALGLVAAGAIAGAARKITQARTAKRIDVTHQLNDRIGSALAFAIDPAPTPFMLAAVADAAKFAEKIDPRRAAPFARPPALGPAGLLGLTAALVALLHFPSRARVADVLPPSAPHLTVEHDLIAPERDAATELAKEAERTDDKETKELAENLKKMLDQLDAEELTRKQVFDQLAELEKKLKPATDESFEELKKKLRKAGTELGKEKLTREAGEALAKDDLEKAKEELKKLAEQAEKLDAEKKKDAPEQKKLSEEDRRSLERSLDRAAKATQEKQQQDQKRAAEEKKLRDEERRLKKELAERPNDQELQRKLQRNQRELQRLEREKQQRAQQDRELQRLQRELQQAAEQLRQKLSPEAAEALRRAAQQLGDMQNEIKKLGNQKSAQAQIAELKEMLRRAGQLSVGQVGQNGPPQNGSGKEGQNGQNGKDGQGQNGQNGQAQNGKGDGKQLMRDFNNRAGGEKNALILGQGNTPILLPLPQGPGDQNGLGKPGPGEMGPQPGDGIGDQHDPNMTGDPTKLASKRHDTRVQGKDAAGPSRSETILGAAERGFASSGYKRVYSDYTSVVEEVMSKERVPPGYRYYIKRYFQLIKPRD